MDVPSVSKAPNKHHACLIPVHGHQPVGSRDANRAIFKIHYLQGIFLRVMDLDTDTCPASQLHPNIVLRSANLKSFEWKNDLTAFIKQ